MDKFLKQFWAVLQQLSRSQILFGIELIVSGVVGLVIVFPILAALLALNELGRLCQSICMWIVYGDEFKLSPDECGSNYSIVMAKKKRHTILYLGELEGELDLQTVRDNFQNHVMGNKAYARLKQIWQQKWFYMCLKKCENFDISNHVRAYPGSENRTVTEKELFQKILPELSEDMTGLDKPQWEVVIIPRYQETSGDSDDPEADTQFAPTKSLKVIRIHHSYMDGASTLVMIADTFTAEGESFPYVIDPCKPLKISKVAMFFFKLTSLALLTSSIVKTLISPPHTRHTRFTLSGSPKSDSGKPLFSRTEKIPISSFQSIKDKSGVSMSAIVSAVLSRAVRNLEKKYPNKNASEKIVNQQQPLWLVAGMFPYDRKKPCNNHIGLETIIDTSDISGCDLLSLMNDELGRLTKNPLIPVVFWEYKMVGRIPIMLSKLFLDMAVCSIVLSNIPLCTRSIKMWEKECTGIMGFVPLICNTGLGIVSIRYNDHFRYCIQADSSVMSEEELDYFTTQLEEQVDALRWETSQLKRRISMDTSLFAREKEDKSLTDLSLLSTEIKEGYVKDNSNNNVENKWGDDDISHMDENSTTFPTANYPFIYKLKNSIEQIKGGIKKIKEQ